jgi:hypothetical protein
VREKNIEEGRRKRWHAGRSREAQSFNHLIVNPIPQFPDIIGQRAVEKVALFGLSPSPNLLR